MPEIRKRRRKRRSRSQSERFTNIIMVVAVIVLAGALWWAMTDNHTTATDPIQNDSSAEKVLGNTKIH